MKLAIEQYYSFKIEGAESIMNTINEDHRLTLTQVKAIYGRLFEAFKRHCQQMEINGAYKSKRMAEAISKNMELRSKSKETLNINSRKADILDTI